MSKTTSVNIVIGHGKTGNNDADKPIGDMTMGELASYKAELRLRAYRGGPRGRVARFVLHQMQTGKGLPV